ncbi:hypothetical protein M2281_004013 [Mesorhizobium soli]|nr:hypothetical protein [Mesorhizobium soli]
MGPLIKFIGAAVWICLVTLGAVFYSFKTPHALTDPGSPPPLLGGLKYVKANVISVPVFNKASVEGYFLARLVYTADPKELKKLTVPAESLITDQVYSYLYANPEIDFSKREDLDLEAFRNGIRDSINGRIGEQIIHDVIVEQIDFLTREETRDRSARRRNEQADAAAEAAPAPAEHH